MHAGGYFEARAVPYTTPVLTSARVLERLGMRPHPEKSGITCLTRGGQGFEFLGFHHRKVDLSSTVESAV
ncbi:hypothetical protein ACWD5R_44560 [Streptomyces sp. NPDC002514]|uniref:hypothetical protein n=1 Tax=Streptomyces sp. NPDC001270 TaxID=3364554 RepID=UPI0036AE579C